MQNLIVYLSENILKVSSATPENFKSATAELGENVVRGTEILEMQTFTQILQNLIKEVTSGSKDKKYELNFLLDPRDVILKFITVRKGAGDHEEMVLSEIKSKLGDVNLEDLYFSYQKIAPFVYQFVGIEKAKLEKFLEISNNVGIELRSVVPWVMLLPKFVGKNEPTIFVSKSGKSQMVVLSELGGIYFCDVFNKEKSTEDLEKYVAELSVYKRSQPINKIYTIDGGLAESFSLNPSYEVSPLVPYSEIPEEIRGYEIMAVFYKVVTDDPSLLDTQNNLLNLLPLPAVAKKSSSLVYVAASIVLFLLLGGVLIYKFRSSPPAASSANNGGVLSESNQSTPSQPQQPAEQPPAQLNKADIKIRVENAAGIPGLAAKTQTFLQDKGWTVPEIDTATVSRSDTLIKIKTSKKDFLPLLVDDMKGSYQTVTEQGLDENLSYDVLIQVGTK